MHPLRNGSQAVARPAAKPVSGSPGWFTESGDDNKPSYPGADWFNHVIAEFQNALAAQGIIFDPTKDDHLLKALAPIKPLYDVPIKDIFYKNKPKDISAKLEADGYTVVITGDSLSFNNYGYNFPYELNAYECYPGIRSWSFMLRDFIHTCDPCFVYGDNISYVIKAGSPVISKTTENSFVAPFNGRVAKISPQTSADIIGFSVRSANVQSPKTVIYMMHNAEGDDFKFDVYADNGSGPELQSVVVIGNSTNYKNLSPFELVLSKYSSADKPLKITFQNFRNVDDSSLVSPPGSFYVNAVGTKKTTVKMTGKGGATSADILAEYEARIGQYAPDILVLQIGANDRLSLTLDEHVENLNDIIQNAKLSNPNIQVILMNSTPGNPALLPNHYPDNVVFNGYTMRDMVEAEKRVAVENDALFLDVYRYFYNDKNYLFDQIHLSRLGNTMIFKAFVSLFCSSAKGFLGHFDGTTYFKDNTLLGRQAKLMQLTPAVIKPKGYAVLRMVAGAWTVSSSSDFDGALLSVGKPPALPVGAIEVKFNFEMLSGADGGITVKFQQTGSITKVLQIFQRELGRQSAIATIFDMSTTPPTLATDATLQNEYILLEWF